jgi:hypothetical protein
MIVGTVIINRFRIGRARTTKIPRKRTTSSLWFDDSRNFTGLPFHYRFYAVVIFAVRRWYCRKRAIAKGWMIYICG